MGELLITVQPLNDEIIRIHSTEFRQQITAKDLMRPSEAVYGVGLLRSRTGEKTYWPSSPELVPWGEYTYLVNPSWGCSKGNSIFRIGC